MHTTVSYKDRPARDAVLDYAQWCGYRRARLMARLAKHGGTWQQFNFYSGLMGVTGAPVTNAWRRWTGTEPQWEEDNQ